MQPIIEGTLDLQRPNEVEDEKYYAKVCVTYHQQAVRVEYERLLSSELPDSLGKYETLPRDVYRNKRTWMLQQVATTRFVVLAVLLFFFLWGYRIELRSNCFGCFGFLYRYGVTYFLNCLIFGRLFSFTSKYQKIGLLTNIRLLSIINNVKDSSTSERLDQAARYMNQYLRSEEVWKDPDEYFFDGKECLSFFQEQLSPLASDPIFHGDVIAYYELKGMVSETLESLKSSK